MQKTKRLAKLLGITFIVLTTLNTCKAKTDTIDYVKLEINQSRRIPNNKVRIEITKEKSRHLLHIKSLPMFKNEDWNKTIIDTTFVIKEDAFNIISEEVLKLSKCDFSKSKENGLDGAAYSLEFRFERKEIEYNIWSPDYKTEERGLTNYLKVCKRIIEIAGLKTNEII